MGPETKAERITRETAESDKAGAADRKRHPWKRHEARIKRRDALGYSDPLTERDVFDEAAALRDEFERRLS